MTQHCDLTNGRWNEMSFCEQMANVGSEIERALKWQEKNNLEYSEKAILRGLELLNLTIKFNKKKSYFKELTRLKEVILDFFFDSNNYQTTPSSLKKYFYHFNFCARKAT